MDVFEQSFSQFKETSLLQVLAWRAISRFYGVFSMGMFTLAMLMDGSLFRRRSQKAQQQLAQARQDLWDLTLTTFGEHKFHKLQSGLQLHYIVADTRRDSSVPQSSPTNLVILLHGFPDSWYLWNEFLGSKEISQKARLVALDLPGHGGSDGLAKYDTTSCMEAVTEFVLDMKDQYLHDQDGGRLILVAHDWGGIIAYRIATDAPQLIDRLIVSNTVNADHVLSMVKDRATAAKTMFHTWSTQTSMWPRVFCHKLTLLRKALDNFSPVLAQIRRSGYVFVFNLPAPLSTRLGTLGDFWFYRLMAAIGLQRRIAPLDDEHTAYSVASSLGPSTRECASSTPAGNDTYGRSVLQRAQRVDGGWPEKIRLYREGLSTGQWQKSIQTVIALQQLDRVSEREHHKRRAASVAGLFDEVKGALKVPTTIVWGVKDVALDKRICLDGINEYLGKNSQVVVMPNEGHWLPVGKEGGSVMRECLSWVLDGEEGRLRDRLLESDKPLKFVVDK